MRSLKEIKERSDTAHLMIAKFGAEGEKTVCYQSMEDIPQLLTTIESQQVEIEDLVADSTDQLFSIKALSDVEAVHLQQIESQKEEIEKLRHRDRVVSLTNETLGRYVNEGKMEIKSLKAIKELAVKGLKDVSDVDTSSFTNDTWLMRDIANNALSEIESIQNAQT